VGALSDTHASRRSAERSSPAISQPQPKLQRVVANAFGLVARLAFTTTPSAFLIGSRLRYAPSPETYRFARSKPLGTARRPCPSGRTPLMGFIDSPLHRHTVAASTPVWAVTQTSARDCQVQGSFRSCRSSRLQRFSPQRPRSEDRDLDSSQVCCTLQPIGGFTTFWVPGDTRPPTILSERFRNPPRWRIPFEAFPSPAAGPQRHRGWFLLTEEPAFTAWRALSPLARRAGLRVSTMAGPRPRPQGFLPLESPWLVCGVSVATNPMLPWALDRYVSGACRARRRWMETIHFALRYNPAGASFATREWRGRQSSRLGLAPSGPMLLPTRRSAARRSGSLAARRLLRFRSARSRSFAGVDRDRSLWLWSFPKEEPRPRPCADPEGFGSGAGGRIPRDDPSVAGPSHPKVLGLRLVAFRASEEVRTTTPAHSPGGLAPVSSLIAGRAFRATRRRRVPRVLDLARADVGTTRKWCKSTCHSCCAPKSTSSNPRRHSRKSRARGEPHATRGRLLLVAPTHPASWNRSASGQTDIVSIKTAGPKSQTTRRSSTDASAGGAVVAAQATRVVGWPPSQGTEVSRAEANRSLLRAPEASPKCVRSVTAEAFPEP